MRLSAWRVALRIARRDALRAKGRSALVVAMVALPVLGVTGADVVFRSAELDPGERVVRTMGQADAEVHLLERGSVVLQAPDPAEDFSIDSASDTKLENGQPKYTPEQRRSLDTGTAELAGQLLPPGATLVPVNQGPYVPTSTREGLLNVQTVEADLTDPVWKGRINVVDGRAPSAGNETAVTRDFLDRSGLKLGDRTTVRGLEGTPFTITAVAEYPAELNTTGLIARPGTLVGPLERLAGPDQGKGGAPAAGETNRWLVKLPAGAVIDWPKVMEFNKYGFTVASRTVVLDPPPRSEVPFYAHQDQSGGGTNYLDKTSVVILATVVGMALLEIVLLAGPAFAVGARRSRRQLGLLAAGGGDRANIRAVVLGGGIVLGVTGATVGLAVGVGLVALLRTRTEEYAGARFGHFDLQPLDLLGVLAIGLVTGLLAAVVPAVQASRQDVVSALTGRDSLKPPSRKLAVLGLLMLAGGAAIALLAATSGFGNRSMSVLGGSVIAELGMVALTPYLVGLFGRIGRWLPLGPRLALRDSVRHRGRTAPAVAAVMAAVAGSVAVGIYNASSDEQQRREYVAAAPANAVSISSGWGAGADGKLLPQMRAAVETNIPGLGTRADVQRVGYKNDCSVVRTDCGYVNSVMPKERRCPLNDGAPSAIPEAEANRIRKEDERCKERLLYRGNSFGGVLAGDTTLLHNLYGVTDPAAGQALAAGKAVVFDGKYVKDGKLTLNLVEMEPVGLKPGDSYSPPSHEITVDAVLVTAGIATGGGQAVMSPDTAHRLGLTTRDSGSVWLPGEAPSDSSEQKANAALAKLTDGIQFNVERGFQPVGTLVSLGLTGFAALVALGAAGIATGLAAADSQRDLTTLAAVGAAPRIRRTLSGFQCGVIAVMGTLLGVVTGVVPAVALRKVEGVAVVYQGMSAEEVADRSIIVFPWLNVGVTVVVLPLLAVALAALLTRSRISLLRRSG
ncbi:ABC transporter permease [Kitasatospora sp. RG8]|uniref:ABC transporter permease n=1 Tax=Kitasatospora sp. RG8 TaxID=2820815 RepID=UPI001ADF661E|nr:ABC transporter permease [Kitasatospora sp. RG8]MBP0449512.1 ABC transporter permease [Kitasatospora sp. RG8]